MKKNTDIAGYMRLKEVLKVYPVSKSTWWKGVKEGRFPKPDKLSARLVAWRYEDISALIEVTKSR